MNVHFNPLVNLDIFKGGVSTLIYEAIKAQKFSWILCFPGILEFSQPLLIYLKAIFTSHSTFIKPDQSIPVNVHRNRFCTPIS